MEKRETKSPIKDLPVHQAGASSRKYVDKLIDGKAMEPVLMAILIGLVAFIEWCNYFFKLSLAVPITFTIIAMIVVVWAFFKVRAVHSKVKALRLGIMGEEAVGQYLEEKLRPIGCQVMHDVPGDSFNLDHVVIGPTGVFCIETKTRSKPAYGSPPVQYDGEKITVNGFPDRDPIVQVKSAACWLHDLLERTTGKKFMVKPIVLYPGWFVKKMPENADVWVLNEKALPTFISNAKNNPLPLEDISLITFHLKRYVISEMENKKY